MPPGSSLEPDTRHTVEEPEVSGQPSREKELASASTANVRRACSARHHGATWHHVGQRGLPVRLHERRSRGRLLELTRRSTDLPATRLPDRTAGRSAHRSAARSAHRRLEMPVRAGLERRGVRVGRDLSLAHGPRVHSPGRQLTPLPGRLPGLHGSHRRLNDHRVSHGVSPEIRDIAYCSFAGSVAGAFAAASRSFSFFTNSRTCASSIGASYTMPSLIV